MACSGCDVKCLEMFCCRGLIRLLFDSIKANSIYKDSEFWSTENAWYMYICVLLHWMEKMNVVPPHWNANKCPAVTNLKCDLNAFLWWNSFSDIKKSSVPALCKKCYYRPFQSAHLHVDVPVLIYLIVWSHSVNIVLPAVCSCVDPPLHSLCMLTFPLTLRSITIPWMPALLHASTSHPDPAPLPPSPWLLPPLVC